MDPQGYPDEKELATIRDWDIKGATDLHAIMQYVKERWHFADWGFDSEDEVYYLSTGGWSGNESIIDALRGNWMFWLLFWQQSRRGGHYIFCEIGKAIEGKILRLEQFKAIEKQEG